MKWSLTGVCLLASLACACTLGAANLKLLAELPEDVTITSLCARHSPNSNMSWRNAMASLCGVPASPTSHLEDPAAWYVIPPDGLQWSDFVTTTNYNMWRGTTGLLGDKVAGEFGNRIVVHARGRYPVSAYTQRTEFLGITNFTDSVFNIATNTATGQEIPFNVNFIGVDLGTNGNFDSFYSPVIVNWVQGGDDKVYSNGELPSQVPYKEWLRFGSTISITTTNPSQLAGIMTQFVHGVPSIKVELLRDGTVVYSSTVTAERAKLGIAHATGQNVMMMVMSGQYGVPYVLYSATNAYDAPFLRYRGGAVYRGQVFPLDNDTVQRYFRLLARDVPD